MLDRVGATSPATINRPASTSVPPSARVAVGVAVARGGGAVRRGRGGFARGGALLHPSAIVFESDDEMDAE
jgi:hypothetical protein